MYFLLVLFLVYLEISILTFIWLYLRPKLWNSLICSHQDFLAYALLIFKDKYLFAVGLSLCIIVQQHPGPLTTRCPQLVNTKNVSRQCQNHSLTHVRTLTGLQWLNRLSYGIKESSQCWHGKWHKGVLAPTRRRSLKKRVLFSYYSHSYIRLYRIMYIRIYTMYVKGSFCGNRHGDSLRN